MHLYLWSIPKLQKKLERYSGGQFQIETKDGVYRGKIADIKLSSNPKERRLEVRLDWLCIRRIRNDDFQLRTPVWEEVPRQERVSRHCIAVKFKWYYFQRKRSDRNERVKLKTDFNEICRFYRFNDPCCLVKDNDGYGELGHKLTQNSV